MSGMTPDLQPPVTPTDDGETILPQRKGMRLRQLLDVSRKDPAPDNALVYNATTGIWEPADISIDPTIPARITTLEQDVDTVEGNVTSLEVSVENRFAALTPESIGASPDNHGHSLASGNVAGFISGEEATKLAGVSALAAALATTGTPNALTVAQAGARGAATTAARSDHRHGLPGVATSAASGFMSNTDKARLDALTLRAPTVLELGFGETFTNTLTAVTGWSHNVAAPGWYLVMVNANLLGSSDATAPSQMTLFCFHSGASVSPFISGNLDVAGSSRTTMVGHWLINTAAAGELIQIYRQYNTGPTTGSVSMQAGSKFSVIPLMLT